MNSDRRFVIANPDPLVRPVHPLDVLPREAKRQEAEYVLAQVAVAARVSRDDDQIRGNDRVWHDAPDSTLQRPESLGITSGHPRRLRGETACILDLHAAVIHRA